MSERPLTCDSLDAIGREYEKALVDEVAGRRAQPIRELHGECAATHVALEAAAKKVEEANRILTDAQHDFRKALAAHMAALTGTKANP